MEKARGREFLFFSLPKSAAKDRNVRFRAYSGRSKCVLIGGLSGTSAFTNSGHSRSLNTLVSNGRLRPEADIREFWRSALANGNVVAHSLITITANHPKNPTKGTNKDHASQGRERRMAILAPKRSTGNTSAIHVNLGVPNK